MNANAQPPADLGLSRDGIAAFKKLCSIGCDPEELSGLLRWLAADEIEFEREPARRPLSPDRTTLLPPRPGSLAADFPESLAGDLPTPAPTGKEVLPLHALDRSIDKKTRRELEKISKSPQALCNAIQAFCDAVQRLSQMPVVRALNERGCFGPRDFLRAHPRPPYPLDDLRERSEEFVSLLRKRSEGVVNLPDLIKEFTGPQKYPDRKEWLLLLVRYVHGVIIEQRARQGGETAKTSDPWREVASLLAPILIEILPQDSGLNKANRPLTADSLYRWCLRHAAPSRDGTHKSNKRGF
jgi:hypothetical protein